MGILHNDDLRKVIPQSVEPYNLSVVEDAHYELSLGSEYYTTASDDGEKVLVADNGTIVIKPGQFALLITKETITIPQNIVALISIKASIKFKGLINISGFHVDPGFIGKLKFAVYNAGTRDIVLSPGQRLFPMWFCQLTGENPPYNGGHNHQTMIEGKDIEAIQGNVVSPSVLHEKFTTLESRIGSFTGTFNIVAAIFATVLAGILVLAIGKFIDNAITNNLMGISDRQTKAESNLNGLGSKISDQQQELEKMKLTIEALENFDAIKEKNGKEIKDK